MTVRDQLRYELDNLRDRLGRLRHVVREAELEVANVLDVPIRRARGELRARSVASRDVDLVVDVGDVVDERDVVAAQAQPVAKPHADDERARVPDVCARVDRRAAEVHANWSRGRRELDFRALKRAIEPHRSCAAPPPAAALRSPPTARARAPVLSAQAGATSGHRRRPSARARAHARRRCRLRARRAP